VNRDGGKKERKKENQQHAAPSGGLPPGLALAVSTPPPFRSNFQSGPLATSFEKWSHISFN